MSLPRNLCTGCPWYIQGKCNKQPGWGLVPDHEIKSLTQ